MKKLKTIYQDLWQYYRDHLWKLHLIILAVYAVLFVAAGIKAKMQFTPEYVAELMATYGSQASEESQLAAISNPMSPKSPDQMLEQAAERVEWYGLWYHNSVSSLLMIISGIVPGIFLPVWISALNALSWGATWGGIAALLGIPLGKFFVATYAGHAIAEGIVNELGASIGIYLCWLTTKQLAGKNQPGQWRQAWVRAAQLWVLVIIPCLLVCGLLEQYFSGWLAEIVVG